MNMKCKKHLNVTSFYLLVPLIVCHHVVKSVEFVLVSLKAGGCFFVTIDLV